MNSIKIFIALLIFTLSHSVEAYAQDSNDILGDITFITEHLPPYSYKKDGQVCGIGPDVLDAAFENIGSSKDAHAMQVYPWARAYYLAQHQPNICLLITIRTKMREDLFKWVGPVTDFNLVFITKKSLQLDTLEDAKKYRIGVPRAAVAHQQLLKHGFAESQIDPSTNSDFLFEKLCKGRVDVLVVNDKTLEIFQSKGIYSDETHRVNFVLNVGDGYIACNPQTPARPLQALQKSINSIAESGELQNIIAKNMNY